MTRLRDVILSGDPAVRNQALETLCRTAPLADLLPECADLDRFRRGCANLYQRVRALFFLYALDRFHLPARPELPRRGLIPFEGHHRLLVRRFEEAVTLFLAEQAARGPSDALCSALAAAYRELAFQSLADQVRRSVRGVRGNQWMFRVGHPADHPLRLRPELLRRGGPSPVLRERTAVRMDLTHSAWSDIFFLGMDYPEGARVLNVSIDLGVRAPNPGGKCLTFEVIARRIEDRGGGLARVDGRPRLVEGLALPREEDEFRLSYYNTLTTWIDIDRLLAVFGLARGDLADGEKVGAAIRRLAGRTPTYVTLKDVKKRWGHGQEDVYPVCQFEKLWGDMTALAEVRCGFVAVPRRRGQQLKDQAQLDGWLRDGSARHVESLCAWT
jgi:hypothetical protein